MSTYPADWFAPPKEAPADNGHKERQSWRGAFTEAELDLIANCQTQIMQTIGGRMVALIGKMANELDKMEESRDSLPY